MSDRAAVMALEDAAMDVPDLGIVEAELVRRQASGSLTQAHARKAFAHVLDAATKRYAAIYKEDHDPEYPRDGEVEPDRLRSRTVREQVIDRLLRDFIRKHGTIVGRGRRLVPPRKRAASRQPPQYIVIGGKVFKV